MNKRETSNVIKFSTNLLLYCRYFWKDINPMKSMMMMLPIKTTYSESYLNRIIRLYAFVEWKMKNEALENGKVCMYFCVIFLTQPLLFRWNQYLSGFCLITRILFTLLMSLRRSFNSFCRHSICFSWWHMCDWVTRTQTLYNHCNDIDSKNIERWKKKSSNVWITLNLLFLIQRKESYRYPLLMNNFIDYET